MAQNAGNGQGPTTTIPPFNDISKLPACAVRCGALYDANGACVPPAIAPAAASVYEQCFCANSKVAAFSTGSTGPCDAACTTEGGLSSIAGWFQSMCGVDNKQANNGGDKTISTNSAASTGASKAASSNGGDGGGNWLSNHWQWVIFLVVMVVGIAGIWIGACIWRRRYLRKKDRQNTLGQKHSGSDHRPSWGPGVASSASGSIAPQPYDTTAYDSNSNSGPGVFMPGAGAAAPAPAHFEEKPKKKWNVLERT